MRRKTSGWKKLWNIHRKLVELKNKCKDLRNLMRIFNKLKMKNLQKVQMNYWVLLKTQTIDAYYLIFKKEMSLLIT